MKDIINELKTELKNNQTVVVATSGGPDSMTLIDLVNKLAKEKNITIICAHVNHHLRKESEAEAIMVKNYCKNHNIIFRQMDITSYQGNTENYAREKRYNFFETLIKENNASYLLTAHHGDDLVETILMRLVRSSTLKGYCGFPKITLKENYKIYRPLISKTKDEILKYVKENNIPYALDKTNEDQTITRNRYRKHILPVLKKENKNVHKKFLSFSNTLLLYENHINKEVNEIIPKIYKNKTLNINEFNKYDELIKIKIIHHILFDIYKEDITNINDIHTNNILKLIENKKPNITLNMPKNIIVVKEYNSLKFKQKNEAKKYKIKLEDINELPCFIIKKEDTQDSSNFTTRLNSNELAMPLWIRTRKEGDELILKGSNNHKKIKDIFINEKLPKEDRNTWPIITDSKDRIIWLPGLKKTKFDKQKNENYDIILKCYKKGSL